MNCFNCFASGAKPARTGVVNSQRCLVQVAGLARNEKPYFSKIALASELRRKAR
jgi:hypothetical protein